MSMVLSPAAQAQHDALIHGRRCHCGAIAPYYIEVSRQWVCSAHMGDFITRYAARVRQFEAGAQESAPASGYGFRRKHASWYELTEDGVKIGDVFLRGFVWNVVQQGSVTIRAKSLGDIKRHLESLVEEDEPDYCECCLHFPCMCLDIIDRAAS